MGDIRDIKVTSGEGGHDRLTRMAGDAIEHVKSDPRYRHHERIYVLIVDSSDSQDIKSGFSGHQPTATEEEPIDYEMATRDVIRVARVLSSFTNNVKVTLVKTKKNWGL